MLKFEDRARRLRGAIVRLAMASLLGLFSHVVGGCAAGQAYRSSGYSARASSPPASMSQGVSESVAVASTGTATSSPSGDNEGGSYGGGEEANAEQAPESPGASPPPPPPAPVSAPSPSHTQPTRPVVASPVRPERAAVAMSGATGRGPATNTNPGATTQQGTQPNPAPQTPVVVQAPMLIYVAEVQMQTPRAEISATIERVIEAATSIGGYLVRRTDDMVQVRVPSQRFRESLARVEAFGEVLHRSVSADDVSEEYRDVEVRLQNLRAVRRRLEEFLARATTMTDALTVEHELERVTREIDTLEGRLRFLGARVAFSLVTVRVTPRPEHVDIAAPEPSATRRLLNLPVAWLSRLGLERLMDVGNSE